MSKYRFKPTPRGNPKSPWAATLESFFLATSGVANTKQDELVGAYASAGGRLSHVDRHPGRGLIGLTRRLLKPQGVKVDGVGKLLLADAVEDALQSSHVVLLFGPAGITLPYAWLIYGIDNYLIYMDGATGMLGKTKKVSEFTGDNNMLVWRPV